MGKKSLESIFFLFIIIINFNTISVSAQVCMNTSEVFKPNSTYDNNLSLILSTLASNITIYNGVINDWRGVGEDRVYAMGVCAPGAEPNRCSSCIKTSSESLREACGNQTDAYSWLGEDIVCFVRYSSKFFSGVLGLEPRKVLYNSNEIRKENQKEFDSKWDEFMIRMITRASSSSSKSFIRYYAKDEEPVPYYGNISALMQCTPDVTSQGCKVCLESSVDIYRMQYHRQRGSIMSRPSCFFRWEVYAFSGAYDRINDVHSFPSSPPPSETPSADNITTIISPKKKDTKFSGGIIAAIVIIIFVFIISATISIAIFKRRKQKQPQIELPESVQYDLKTIEVATSNFSERNKLGEGGFGEVYKGILMDGTEVAVKRLSKTSGQGEVEFKNEVVVVAKLQHRNLVRLLGCSVQGEEKLLVYEFVPNKSLDYFLFDSEKRIQLDWTMRQTIIVGITRGILYLHQDSRLKIIHRDLKAGNILLDSDMSPKIADFGMARIFGIDQTVANTSRVVGTFGYMPPEYVTHGQFSTKSDVYSFGVLILEIISGKKNSSFYKMDGLVNNLVTYVYKLWENKSLLELIDSGIKEDCDSDEVTRYIHIGLLCVQENPSDRPTMSTIYQMLTTSAVTLPIPLSPGFFFRNKPSCQGSEQGQSSSKSLTCSVDEVTIPR